MYKDKTACRDHYLLFVVIFAGVRKHSCECVLITNRPAARSKAKTLTHHHAARLSVPIPVETSYPIRSPARPLYPRYHHKKHTIQGLPHTLAPIGPRSAPGSCRAVSQGPGSGRCQQTIPRSGPGSASRQQTIPGAGPGSARRNRTPARLKQTNQAHQQTRNARKHTPHRPPHTPKPGKQTDAAFKQSRAQQNGLVRRRIGWTRPTADAIIHSP